jgi:Protein of unknown function (DUF2934)
MNSTATEMKPAQTFTRVPTRNAGSCGNSHSRSPTHQEIERCAYEIYVANRREEGRSDENWFQAEHQLAAYDAASPVAAGVVKA